MKTKTVWKIVDSTGKVFNLEFNSFADADKRCVELGVIFGIWCIPYRMEIAVAA